METLTASIAAKMLTSTIMDAARLSHGVSNLHPVAGHPPGTIRISSVSIEMFHGNRDEDLGPGGFIIPVIDEHRVGLSVDLSITNTEPLCNLRMVDFEDNPFLRFFNFESISDTSPPAR